MLAEHSPWVMSVFVFFGLAFIAAWLLDPAARRWRRFKRQLKSRPPVSDESLFTNHFTCEEALPHVPGVVRRLMGQDSGVPLDQLLPDDDLGFLWEELETIVLQEQLEAEFSVRFTEEELQSLNACTIRQVTQMVTRKLRESSPGT